MPVVDLRGKRAEQQAQMLMMMQQFRNRSTALGGGETELERVEKEIEANRLKREEASRLERTSQAQIGANQALEEQRRNKAALETWKAGEQSKLDWSEDERKRRELEEGTLPLRRAQTEETQAGTALRKQQAVESRARTGKVVAETQGELDEQTRKANEAIYTRAEKQRTLAHQMAAMGEPVDKTGADQLERAERLLQGNPGYVLPRNPDGSWKPPSRPELGMLDEKGNPTTKFAEGLDKIQTPDSPLGKLISDATEAKAKGAPPEVMKRFEQGFVKLTALTPNEVRGSCVQTFIDAGDYEGASQCLAQARSEQKLQMPSKEERMEFSRQSRLVLEIQSIQDRYNDLKAQGRIPVGRIRQPMLDTWAATGTDDPDLQTLRKDIEQMKGEYLLYLSGRAASDQERAEINKRIPSLFDSPQTFEQALPAFQSKVKTNISVDAGILYSLGYKIPDNVPVLPLDEVLKQGPVPNVITETGFIPADFTKQHVKGIGVLGRDPKVVGGVTEFRDKGGPSTGTPGGPEPTESSESQEPPMSTESNAVLSPAMPTDPMQYSNPPKARGLLKEREKLMKSLED